MSSLDLTSSIHLSKTFSIISPISSHRSTSLSLQSHSSFHNLFLPLSVPEFRRRNLSHLSLSRPAGELAGNVESDEEEEEEVLEIEDVDESDVDEVTTEDIDFEALEKEAKLAVRDYSVSLSRELIIDDEINSQKEARGRQRRNKSVSKNIPDHLLPKVAIVGRPNVGKSALFNRLVGGNKAIVVDEPGVTRDRLYGRAFWGDHEFMVVDTGGVLTISKSQSEVMEELAVSTTIGMEGISLASREAAVAKMPSMIERQATVAVEESSVIIFLVDGQVWSIINSRIKYTSGHSVISKYHKTPVNPLNL